MKICAITARTKKCKSIIKIKKKKHGKTVLLVKSKLNRIAVLIFKCLIDSTICHDEFVLINKVCKEYNDMKRNQTFENLTSLVYKNNVIVLLEV